MSKRSTGIEKRAKPRSHKTAKRLEAKKRMLEIRAMKPAARRKALAEERKKNR